EAVPGDAVEHELVLARAGGVAEVLGADVLAAHEHLADLAEWQLAGAVDLDDAELHALERAPDAQAGAARRGRERLGERLLSRELGRRQRLGGAVVRVDLAALAEH